jgi:hypothetical protein
LRQHSGVRLVNSSEDFSVCHKLRDGAKLAVPAISRQAEVVIVGGGPSGLVAGYRLRDRDIVLLEKEPFVGGNARADYWHGMPYAAGSIAFYGASPTAHLHDELGLKPEILTTAHGATIVGHKVISGELWESGLQQLFSAADEKTIRRARDFLLALDIEKEKARLDRITMAELLQAYGLKIKVWFDWLLAYFGGNTESYSAYAGVLLARSQINAGLGILYPEGVSQGGVFTFPGGLSVVASRLKQRIENAGRNRVVTDAAVYHVRQDEHGVNVSYMHGGQPKAVRARAAIFAAPKFIARYIIEDLPPSQSHAMGQMSYVPYIVGAVGVDGVLSTTLRSARILNGPIVSFRDCSSRPDKQLYRIEIPVSPSSRHLLLSDSYFHRLSETVVDYFEKIFPGSRKNIAEVRFWRRGHNWHIPVPRMITEFQSAAAQQHGRIFFANADSIGPISEFGWAMIAADRAVAGAKRLLTSSRQ